MFHRQHFPPMVHEVVLRTLLAVGLLGGVGAQASENVAQAHFAEIGEFARAAGRLIDPEPMDIDAVIGQVGLEPAALAAWVHEHVAFEPYAGIMKGPVGTLVSGRANAADQALLLAVLLESAGISAELARGRIRVSELPDPTLPELPAEAGPDPSELASLAERLGSAPDALASYWQGARAARHGFLERLWSRTLDDLEHIGTALDDADVPVPNYLTPDAAATVEHWWVRTAAGDLDPVTGHGSGEAQATYALAALPEEVFHRLTIRLMIESADGSVAGPRNAPESVLDVTLRTADVFGTTVALGNVPLDAGDPIASLRGPQPLEVLEALGAAGQFQPQLVTPHGTLTGHPFDLSGQRLNVRDGRIERVQAVGRAAGGMLGGLGGALGGRAPPEDETPATVLVGHWLELELHAPVLENAANDPVRIRRELLRDPATGTQAVLDILATRELLVMPDQLTGDWLTGESLRYTAGWAKFAQRMTEEASPWRPAESPLDLGAYIDRPHLTAPLYAFGVAQRTELRRLRDALAPDTFYWRDQPMVASYVRELRAPDGDHPAHVLAGLDILHNTLAVSGETADRWTGHLAFASGVLDTALELAVTEPAAGGGRRWNTSLALERSLVAGELPRVAADETNGLRVYVGAADDQPSAWYCVSRASGTSLGMIEGGGGQAMTEYAEQVATFMQLRGLLSFYGDLFTCLGLAVTLPLAMDADAQSWDLKECVWDLACGQVTGLIGAFVDIETDWTNLIVQKTVDDLWSDVCDGAWAAVVGN